MVAAEPVLPQGERFPFLWLFIHHATATKVDAIAILLSNLQTLQAYLQEHADPDEEQVGRLFKGAESTYQILRDLQLWGVTEGQRHAFTLVQAEVYSAFPTLAKTNKGKSSAASRSNLNVDPTAYVAPITAEYVVDAVLTAIVIIAVSMIFSTAILVVAQRQGWPRGPIGPIAGK